MESEELEIFFNEIIHHFEKSIKITRPQIFDALFLLLADRMDLDHPVQLLDLDISTEEAIDLLTNFDFYTLERKVYTEDDYILASELFVKKARFKQSGQIWIIHKNDKDPNPSNPHAHNIEQNIKLDLSTGYCYRNRVLLYSINKRQLIKIRDKAKEVYHGDLPNLK